MFVSVSCDQTPAPSCAPCVHPSPTSTFDTHVIHASQRVTTKASASLSGTFQLSFNGETTGAVNAAATAEEVRSALESLSGITTAAVSRGYSVEAMGGDTGAADLNVTFGSQTAWCSNGEYCDNTGLRTPIPRLRGSEDTGCLRLQVQKFLSCFSNPRKYLCLIRCTKRAWVSVLLGCHLLRTGDMCDFGFSPCQLIRLDNIWYRVKSSFEAEGSGQVSYHTSFECLVVSYVCEEIASVGRESSYEPARNPAQACQYDSAGTYFLPGSPTEPK